MVAIILWVLMYEIHHPYMHVYTAIPTTAMQNYHKYNSLLSAKTFHSDLFLQMYLVISYTG